MKEKTMPTWAIITIYILLTITLTIVGALFISPDYPDDDDYDDDYDYLDFWSFKETLRGFIAIIIPMIVPWLIIYAIYNKMTTKKFQILQIIKLLRLLALGYFLLVIERKD